MGTRTVTLPIKADLNSRQGRRYKRTFDEAYNWMKQQRWQAAADGFTRVINMGGAGTFQALANRGICYYNLGRMGEALRDYQIVSGHSDPALAEMVRINRGLVLTQYHEWDAALADFMTAKQAGDFMNASYIHLMHGRFREGLLLYRNRPSVERWRLPLRKLDDLAGKDVLILHEQGFGDSIMMARFVPAIVKVARSVHWASKAPLIPLFQQIPGVTFSHVNDDDVPALIAKYDRAVLTMDLWQTTTPDLTISGKPYLRAAPFLMFPDEIKIGVCWRGRPEFGNDFHRSVAPHELNRLFEARPDARWISLQPDLRDDERVDGLYDIGPLVRSFAETAQIISQLDIVVSVDTAVAHLAGALGKPVILLLPWVPDWRWQLARSDSPWYDSVTICRQQSYADWPSAVASALPHLL